MQVLFRRSFFKISAWLDCGKTLDLHVGVNNSYRGLHRTFYCRGNGVFIIVKIKLKKQKNKFMTCLPFQREKKKKRKKEMACSPFERENIKKT